MIHRPMSLKIEEDCDDPLEPLKEKFNVPVPKEAQSLSVPGINQYLHLARVSVFQ